MSGKGRFIVEEDAPGKGCLLYIPDEYKEEEKHPLLLFLHGAGERGPDTEAVKKHGPPKLIEAGSDFPFIMAAPQCPAGSWWSSELHRLHGLLESLKARYNVDEDRIYLTGLSMGGYGTWDMAMEYPGTFAALAPICGGSRDKEGFKKIARIPVWVFHGEEDRVVPFELSREAVEILTDLGADVRFTAYPGVGHDSYTRTYENPELYEWMLRQKRKTAVDI
ncbi:MAG: prolyl oligopeptidase family serine peptidase [Clostridia bacterium]|nr:prolyl oligopeptidase family serine peptidase [Clostridia bacterium]